MRSAGAGWLQIVSDFDDQDKEFGLFRRLAEASGRPVTLTLLQSHTRPEAWRDLLAQIEAANAAGLRITGQVRSRPTSVLLGFELSQNPFVGRPSYKKIIGLRFAERMQHLRDPAFRAALLAEASRGGRPCRTRRALGPHVPARRPAGLRTHARATAWPRGPPARDGLPMRLPTTC